MYMGSNASPNNLCSQPREEDDDNDGMKENLHRCKHTGEGAVAWWWTAHKTLATLVRDSGEGLKCQHTFSVSQLTWDS